MFGEYPLMASVSLILLQLGLLVGVVVLLVRINRLRQQRDALLEAKNVVFNFIYDVSEVFAETDKVDVSALLKRVVSYGLRVTEAKAGALYLVDADDETMRPGAVIGMFPPLAGDLADIRGAFSKVRFVERLVRERTIRVGEGLIGQVLAEGMPILIEEGEKDERVPDFGFEFLAIHSILLVPMRFRHRVLGVLAVMNRMDGRAFNETDQNLMQALADQASVSIHYARFSSALDEKRRLDYDLGIARRIQTALLPKEIPQIEGVDIAAFSVPAQQIGGDYYDFIAVDDRHLGIVIADVSGKGVPGAIVMSICRSLLRTEAYGCLSPAKVLREVNRSLSGDLSEDMFVSVLYMILDTESRELTVCRGGHVHPILSPMRGAEPRIIKSGGLAIGLADTEVFEAALEEKKVQLNPGDMVVVYTDGVTEAHDRGEQEWGVLNLAQTVQAVNFEGGDVTTLSSRVRQRLLEFSRSAQQYDDMTFVALQIAR